MTPATSGPTSPTRLGTYDPDSCSWRTSVGMYDEVSTVSSRTWPLWGMTRAGALYALPTPALPTDASGSSSLLKTPTAQLAVNGGSQHPDKRRAGGHGPTLADEVEWLLPTPTSAKAGNDTSLTCSGDARTRPNKLGWAVALLPTPRATDGTKGGPNQRGSSGDLMLPSAVLHLLPTPTARDWKGENQRRDTTCLPGVFTSPPSDAGSRSPDTELPGQLSLADVEERSG